MLSSCRLYSWKRFTCTSNSIVSGFTPLTPQSSRATLARRALLSRFTRIHARCSASSRECCLRPASSDRSSSHWSVPRRSVSSAARPGFAWPSQRRGVTPFVTLWNLDGHSCAKSGNTSFFTISEWMRATPFTAWLPTMARCDMRIMRVPPSSMIDMRRRRSMSPGQRRSTSPRKRALMSKMMRSCRGSRWPMRSTDHRSSASGSTVWLVYENVRVVIAHASSHDRPSTSVSRRMSSAMPSDGCVSLSWMAHMSLSSAIGRPLRLKRRSTSCSVALTKKYCCLRRSSLPSDVLSFGYSTCVMFSHFCLSSMAR
mmetsp:Transcript_39625/g.97060  ORF Transcript_39625/g.97060 Transcript_39625/m.97060 type:complete len:313 (-) Transcript_39625:888-1826(-)